MRGTGLGALAGWAFGVQNWRARGNATCAHRILRLSHDMQWQGVAVAPVNNTWRPARLLIPGRADVVRFRGQGSRQRRLPASNPMLHCACASNERICASHLLDSQRLLCVRNATVPAIKFPPKTDEHSAQAN